MSWYCNRCDNWMSSTTQEQTLGYGSRKVTVEQSCYVCRGCLTITVSPEMREENDKAFLSAWQAKYDGPPPECTIKDLRSVKFHLLQSEYDKLEYLCRESKDFTGEEESFGQVLRRLIDNAYGE